MKKVWFLNHYALEPSGAGGTRHYGLARHLLKYDWRATVIAASVELNTGKQRLLSGESKRIDHYDGIPFLWIRTPQYQGNGRGRMLNMLAYTFRVLLPSITHELDRPDAIVGSSVHPFAAWAGAILARRFRVPFLFEVRDLWPQTLIDLGRLSERGLVACCMRFMEKWLYRRADRIITLLPQAHDYITPLGIAPEKIVWIPNGVELDGYAEPKPPADDETFTLMYFGAHGRANGLESILWSMKELNQKPNMAHVSLRLIGDGPLKPDLMRRAEELKLKNVTFEDPVPKKNIPLVASEADAFIFNLIDSPVFNFGISSNKLFDFLAAARPVLFCCASSNNPIDDSGAGMTIPPGDPLALAAGIETLVNMPHPERIAMGRAGRIFVEKNHSYERLAEKYNIILSELVHVKR